MAVTCESVAERLELLHYGEIEGAERGEVEAHVAACPGCRGALERVRETASLLDEALEVPAPGEVAWTRTLIRMNAAIGGYRAERARRFFGTARRRLLRVAAVLLLGGALGTSAYLYAEMRERDEGMKAAQNEVAVLKNVKIPSMKMRVRWALGPAGDKWEVARTQIGERQREQLAMILWEEPESPIVDSALAALIRPVGEPIALPSVDALAEQPLVLVPPPPPGVARREHYAGQIQKLKRYAKDAPEEEVRLALRFRAARIAEEDLRDVDLARREYGELLPLLPAGAPLRAVTEQRLVALAGQ